MFTLDLRTVILLSSVMSALMSIVLFSAYRNFPATIKGTGWWTAGSVLMLAVAILFGMRGILPDWLSIVVGNAVMLISVGCRLAGTQEFYGRKPAWHAVLLITALGTGGAAWCSLVQPDFQMRVVLMAPLLAILYGAQFFLIVRYAERHLGSYFFGGTMLVQTAVILSCFLNGLTGKVRYTDFYTGDLTQSIYVAIYSFTTMTVAVGFIMVATRRLHAELERVSNTDPLTEALNRRAFAGIYGNEMRRIKRHEHPMSLLIMDLDHFKRINDKHGHAVGDNVLIHFSSTVMQLLRGVDHFARFGGEEFVALLPETTATEAQAVAERICERLRQAGDAAIPSYTVSMGLAEVTDSDESLDSVVSRADAALYRAKSAGRDRLELAAPLQGIKPAETASANDHLVSLGKTGR